MFNIMQPIDNIPSKTFENNKKCLALLHSTGKLKDRSRKNKLE